MKIMLAWDTQVLVHVYMLLATGQASWDSYQQIQHCQMCKSCIVYFKDSIIVFLVYLLWPSAGNDATCHSIRSMESLAYIVSSMSQWRLQLWCRTRNTFYYVKHISTCHLHACRNDRLLHRHVAVVTSLQTIYLQQHYSHAPGLCSSAGLSEMMNYYCHWNWFLDLNKSSFQFPFFVFIDGKVFKAIFCHTSQQSW
jgi:hypothetical protein